MDSELFIQIWQFTGNEGAKVNELDTLPYQPVSLPLQDCGEIIEHCGCCSTGWAIDAANECWVSIGSGTTMYRVTREIMESDKKAADPNYDY